MNQTRFSPKKHGFDFENNFKNKVRVFLLFKMETDGLCGGMSYAALDYYHAAIRRADYEPELYTYLMKRQLDSFTFKDSWKFFQWTRKSNLSIVSKTLQNEIPKIKRNIDNGTPVVLGLVGATKIRDIGNDNHQVVCYGYGSDHQGQTQLCIYDPNCPPDDNFSGEIIISQEKTAGSGKDVPGDSAEPIKTETGGAYVRFREDKSKAGKPDKLWRGMFVQHYKPNSNPPVIRSEDRDHQRGGRTRDHRKDNVRDHRDQNDRERVVRDHRSRRSRSSKGAGQPKVRDHRTQRN